MERPVVLVDAMNAMRSRWPNVQAAAFVELVERWGEREGVDATIVFDGAAPPVPACRVQLVASRRGESADDWIAAEAERLAARGARVWVVTSDRELRERVATFAERTIGGGSFVTQLARERR